MKLVFIYGQAGVGKLTVGKELAARTGFALFHNHLVVDAVGSVFPFGTEAFVKLRERWWLDMVAEAVALNRSLIFTFAPEPTVAANFPERVRALVEAGGSKIYFIRLTLDHEEQERRIAAPSRGEFGKMMSADLLRSLRPQFEAAMAVMPAPLLSIDTELIDPVAAADAIEQAISRPS